MAERLEPVRGLQVIWRGVYKIEHGGHSYAVEVDFLDFAERVHLYRDRARVATDRSPARFEIDRDAAIEASMGLLGMKRLRLVGPGGGRRRCDPRPGLARPGAPPSSAITRSPAACSGRWPGSCSSSRC